MAFSGASNDVLFYSDLGFLARLSKRTSNQLPKYYQNCTLGTGNLCWGSACSLALPCLRVPGNSPFVRHFFFLEKLEKQKRPWASCVLLEPRGT